MRLSRMTDEQLLQAATAAETAAVKASEQSTDKAREALKAQQEQQAAAEAAHKANAERDRLVAALRERGVVHHWPPLTPEQVKAIKQKNARTGRKDPVH